MNATAIKNRNKREIRRRERIVQRHGRFHAFFSAEAFDLSPMMMLRHDGSFSWCSRGNWYLRPNGELVRITAVYQGDLDKARKSYLWEDKEYLGRVSGHVRCIWHDCDSRATQIPVGNFIARRLETMLRDKRFALNYRIPDEKD